MLLAAPAQAARLETQLRARLDYYPSDAAQDWGQRVRARVTLRHDLDILAAKAEVLASHSHTPWASGSYVELGDTHLTWSGETSSVRIGQQQIAWGRADAFRLLDTVNPVRYPDALFDDTADARLPLWLVNWEGQGNDWHWQLLGGKDRRLHASDPGYTQFQPQADTRLKSGGSGDITGVRLGTRLGPVDVAVHGLNSPDPQPLWRPMAGGPPELLSVRRQLWGLSGDWSAGPVVWRGELVTTRSSTLNPQLQLSRQHTRQALLGADWEQGNWFISPQLYWQSTTLPYSAGQHDSSYTSLLLQGKFLQDRLKLRGFWLHGLDTRENWWSLTVNYESSDLLEWRLALDHFRTQPDSLLRSFEALDRLSVEAIVRF